MGGDCSKNAGQADYTPATPPKPFRALAGAPPERRPTAPPTTNGELTNGELRIKTDPGMLAAPPPGIGVLGSGAAYCPSAPPTSKALRDGRLSINRCVSTTAVPATISVATKILTRVLGPPDPQYNPSADKFDLASPEEIELLCNGCLSMIQEHDKSALVVAHPPCRVFGDLHGQLDDLLDLFRWFGFPHRGPGGDLSTTKYIFNGDFVDRGVHLESV